MSLKQTDRRLLWFPEALSAGLSLMVLENILFRGGRQFRKPGHVQAKMGGPGSCEMGSTHSPSPLNRTGL